MGILLAILFLALGILALVAYNGTPHGGPTTTCGPIHAFGQQLTVHTDCRYISAGEVGGAVAFFLLAVIAAVASRPGR
jgi:hypothetical protein